MDKPANDRTFFNSSRGSGSSNPRGRGRGRGGNTRGGKPPNTSQRDQPTKPVLAPPPPTLLKEVPPKIDKPTEQLAVHKDDPLLDDKITSQYGFALVATNRTPIVTPTFTGFGPLVEAIYQSLGGVNRDFRRAISPSVFHYYCNQHLVARISAIRRELGQASQFELEYLELMRHNQYPVPGLLDEYLRGIGCFTTSTNKYFKVKLPDYSFIKQDANDIDLEGWGKFDDETICQWIHYPHPYVYATRIMKDLAYTIDPATNPQDWTLDAKILPDPTPNIHYGVPGHVTTAQVDFQPGTPTANLPGWSPLNKLENEQRAMISQSGITQNDFCESGPKSYWFNANLMANVGGRLSKASDVYRMAPGPHLTMYGSVVNELCVEALTPTQRPRFSKSKPFCMQSALQAFCFEPLEDDFTWASFVSQYRIRLSNFENKCTWSPFEWLDYTKVPQAWDDVKNDFFEEGNVELLNSHEYQTAAFTYSSLIHRAVEHSVIKKTVR